MRIYPIFRQTQMISDVQIFPSRVLQLCATCFWLCFFRWPELQQGFDMQRWHLIFIFDIPKKIPGLNGFNIISWDFMGFNVTPKNIYTRLSRNSPQDYVIVAEAAAREGSEDDEQLPRTRLSESPEPDVTKPTPMEWNQIAADEIAADGF